MIFSSVIFLFYFLPIVLVIYFLIRKKFRNSILLLASFLFYAWGEPKYIVVLLTSIAVNYLVGMGIHIFRERKPAKWILTTGITINLSILFFFKYIDFSIEILNDILPKTLGGGVNPFHIVLPIGLSFFTFQGLSYIIDVYRNTVPVQKNPLYIALYISMFPQLIAGPIVRYEHVAREIETRTENLSDIEGGIARFIIGLSKKVMIADVLAYVSDQIFGLELEQLTSAVAWLGIICYTFQIFFDFSGYSDMAIGLGRILGFHFPENFNVPYVSCSITEFWRRWHISLSNWFRDYLYIPLGGNRKGNVYIHLFIVFMCTGLWHGAEYTFVCWGIWHGIFIILERLNKRKERKISVPKCMGWSYTMFIVMVGWILFRSRDISYAIGFLRTIFGQVSPNFKPYGIAYYLDNQIISTLIAAFLLSVGVPGKITKIFSGRQNLHIGSFIKIFMYCFLLLCCMIMIVNGNYSPFIYFRF